jgi:hypothetical protein
VRNADDFLNRVVSELKLLRGAEEARG